MITIFVWITTMHAIYFFHNLSPDLLIIKIIIVTVVTIAVITNRMILHTIFGLSILIDPKNLLELSGFCNLTEMETG